MQGLCGKTLVAQKTILIVKMSIFLLVRPERIVVILTSSKRPENFRDMTHLMRIYNVSL